jgi:hypothetical protein
MLLLAKKKPSNLALPGVRPAGSIGFSVSLALVVPCTPGLLIFQRLQDTV